jgi:hypothetical protein
MLRCTCGLEFVIVPKEIPLSEPEALRCEDCGREIRGPRCTRYADYVPLRKISPSSAADVSDRTHRIDAVWSSGKGGCFEAIHPALASAFHLPRCVSLRSGLNRGLACRSSVTSDQ